MASLAPNMCASVAAPKVASGGPYCAAVCRCATKRSCAFTAATATGSDTAARVDEGSSPDAVDTSDRATGCGTRSSASTAASTASGQPARCRRRACSRSSSGAYVRS